LGPEPVRSIVIDAVDDDVAIAVFPPRDDVPPPSPTIDFDPGRALILLVLPSVVVKVAVEPDNVVADMAANNPGLEAALSTPPNPCRPLLIPACPCP
jgi:hypothetical protein